MYSFFFKSASPNFHSGVGSINPAREKLRRESLSNAIPTEPAPDLLAPATVLQLVLHGALLAARGHE